MPLTRGIQGPAPEPGPTRLPPPLPPAAGLWARMVAGGSEVVPLKWWGERNPPPAFFRGQQDAPHLPERAGEGASTQGGRVQGFSAHARWSGRWSGRWGWVARPPHVPVIRYSCPAAARGPSQERGRCGSQGWRNGRSAFLLGVGAEVGWWGGWQERLQSRGLQLLLRMAPHRPAPTFSLPAHPTPSHTPASGCP